MRRFFARMVTRATHLSDETISMLVSGELQQSDETRVQAHLAKCWQCRGRRDAFEKAAQQVVGYRKARLEAELPPDPDRRDLFLAELDQMLGQSASVYTWSRMLARIHAFRLSTMNPIYASAVIVCIALMALFWVWQRRPLTVNAAQLLRRAETSDLAATSGKPGVIYQKVRITTSHLKVERELYRDAQGKRHRRPDAIQAKSEPIQEILPSVGVDLDAPLSAASYREWHDAQKSASDEVSKEDGDLLTLVTKVPDNWIQKESLTVRVSDFHPVARTIETRSYGTIEIAEVNYAVLGWNAGIDSLFENPGSVMNLPHIADVHPALIRALPTSLQIDSAELQARIALNHTGADTQDQIAVSHSDVGVIVKGIVPTNQRKWELVSSLGHIPYVHADILSTEELSARRNSGQPLPVSSSGSQTYSTDQPSPLATYIQEKGLSREQLNQVSQRLLDASLTAQQGSSRIAELQERFSSSEQLDPQAHTNLQSLLTTYCKSITDGLDAEIAAIGQIGLAPSTVSDNQSEEGSSDPATLRQYVHQNQILCQELIAASSSSPRSAVTIATDLQLSINRIRAALSAEQKQSR
jgi:hypothetical protein